MELERRGAQRIRRGYAAKDIHPELSGAIIGGAMKVHSALGPGLLESAYEACLCRELAKAGIEFRRQVPMPVVYDGMNLDCGFRLDLVVEGKAVVEIKSVDQIMPIHASQLLTYLKISGLPLGLILNFNVSHLRSGILRKVFRPNP
jgi:GxxExxY protein